jgi:hypothetical protein
LRLLSDIFVCALLYFCLVIYLPVPAYISYWKQLRTPPRAENTIPRDFPGDLPRFGHTAVLHNGTVFIYGGFNGQTKSDILTYTPGHCAHMKVRQASDNLVAFSSNVPKPVDPLEICLLDPDLNYG